MKSAFGTWDLEAGLVPACIILPRQFSGFVKKLTGHLL
jgi:hypothetical protein